jgi:16S rRNA processing protein RimM
MWTALTRRHIGSAVGCSWRKRRIGTISSTLSTAGGELYVVQGADREHLIPAVKELIDKVDFAAGKVIIDPPDGLLDL